MKLTDSNPFHTYGARFRIPSEHTYESWERRLRSVGFERIGRQHEAAMILDTDDLACRSHGVVLCLSRILTESGMQSAALTVQQNATPKTPFERFTYDFSSSSINAQVFERINKTLTQIAGRHLPDTICTYTPDQFDTLCAQVRIIFPTLRLQTDKKRIVYTYGAYRAIFDTLPDALDEYLELETSSPESLDMLLRALMIDDHYRASLEHTL